MNMSSVRENFHEIPLSVALAASLILTACGGGGGETPTSSAETATASNTTSSAALGDASTQAEVQTDGPTARILSASAATSSTIIIKARATLAANVGPIIQLRLNGTVVGTQEVRSKTSQDYSFTVPAVPASANIDIVYTNDLYTVKEDRNLWVTSMTVDGTTYLAGGSTVKYDLGSGSAAFDGLDVIPGREGMYGSGALRFTLRSASASTPAMASPPGYYIDGASGNDLNLGSYDHPWKTLAKLATIRLKQGEGVYLRCGSVFRESLTLSAEQLVDGNIIAGYGAECVSTKATITGATSLRSGWTKSGNIWSRSVPAGTPKITRLYVDNSAHRIARWPNFTSYAKDYALSDVASPATGAQLQVASADRPQLIGKDLVGATIQVRSAPWKVDKRTILSYDPATGTVIFSDQSMSTLSPKAGYVIQDKLWMLDTAGEFFHDTTANRIYVYPATAAQQADMNAFAVEASIRPTALKIAGRPNLVVRDLALTMASGHGLQATDTLGIRVENVVASRNTGSGISLAIFNTAMASSTLRSSITNSVISENWNRGIDGTHLPRLDVTGNKILDTGMVDYSGHAVAAVAVGDAANVTGNVVQNAAFQGINFSGTGGTVIKGNYVAGYCIRLSDCAAIYTWNGPKGSQRKTNQSSLIQDNQVLAATPNMWGTSGGGADVVAGIYLDDFSMGATIQGNWISGMPMGIFLHNTSSTTVDHNALWLNSRAGLWADMDQRDADYMTGNVFSDNEIVRSVQATGTYPALPTINASNAIWFFHQLYGANSITSGSNVFRGNRHVEINGVTTSVALVRDGVGEVFYTAAGWRNFNPNEAALQTPMTFATNVPVTGPELVPKTTFSSTLDSWSTYFNAAQPRGTATFVNSLPECSGGCGQLTASTQGDMLYTAPFSMTAGIPHIFSYSAHFGGNATVAPPYIGRYSAPFDQFADNSGFVTVSSRYGAAGTNLRYEAFFRPKSGDPARVNLQLLTMGVPVAFTNVSVKAVTGFNFANISDWARVVNAPHDSNLSVDCSTLGWSAGCTVLDTQGNVVALPYTVGAGTSRIFYRGDSTWRR